MTAMNTSNQHWSDSLPYPENIEEYVYESLSGNLIPECRLPWVTDIFVPGHPCYEEYAHMHEAYAQLRNRLGVSDEDEDVEHIINALLSHGKILAMEMFRYGRLYEHMLSMK